MGCSAPRIAHLTGLPLSRVRRIMRQHKLSSLHAFKHSGTAEYLADSDLELEAQRGRTWMGGYPFECRPSDYYEGKTHGPVKLYRPNAAGELEFVGVIWQPATEVA